MGFGCSGEQRVSPIRISEMPEIAVIEPISFSLRYLPYFIQTVKLLQFADFDFPAACPVRGD